MLNLTSAGNQGFVDVAPQMVIAVTRQQGEWFTEIVLKDGNVVHVVEDVDEVKKRVRAACETLGFDPRV